jgi:Domain of unknown function (DUF4260)
LGEPEAGVIPRTFASSTTTTPEIAPMTNLQATRRPGARRGNAPMTPLTLRERLEGGAMAALTAVAFIWAGFAWWWLLALFLLFDLSGLGFVAGPRVGAITYNLVHNLVAPTLLLAAHFVLHAAGLPLQAIALVAGCWFFHVAVDRALGFGPRPIEPARRP